MHLLPIGVDHHVPTLARYSARLLAIDMPRFLDSVTTYKPGSYSTRINFLTGIGKYNAAKFLNEQYGFRISRIWSEYHEISKFPGWEELGKLPEVTVQTFATEDDLLNRVWIKANNILENVSRSAHIKNKAKFTQLETSLRKLAISARSTKTELIDSPQIADWWNIYKPPFEI